MGVQTVVKDYGTDILDAIRENDLKRLRSILDKQLKSDHKIQALCITDIRHRPTKKFACPLILAARQEDPSIIQYMLNRGVDPNFVHHTIYTSKRRETVTALHIAVDLSLYATVEALLNANANPNIADHNDETALLIAVKKADRIMTRMLLAKGADPSIADRRDNAALHIATLFGHLQLVKTLLKYDANVYQRGAGGAIPSHIAAREGHIHLIQVFCSRDAGNINIRIPCFSGSREVAPLHLAAENGHVETVIALLDQFRADINLRDSANNTALHCVVLEQYNPHRMRDRDFFYATAKVLVRYRVAINEKNSRGNTALHLAAAHNHPKIVELLLSVGANPFTENDDRCKPIDIVPESDSVSRQLLKSAMTNPRPPALDASMLSIQHDLQNMSMMPGVNMPGVAIGPHQTSTLRRSGVPNGIPPAATLSRSHSHGGASNQLHRSLSNASTAVVGESKSRHLYRQNSNADKRHSKHIQSPDHNSEIALYANTNSRDSNTIPGLGLRSPISPIEPINSSTRPGHSSARDMKRDDPHRKSGRHSHRLSSESAGADQSNFVKEKNRTNRDRSMPASHELSHGRSSKKEKDRSFDGTRRTSEHRRSASADRHSKSFTEGSGSHSHKKDKSHKDKPMRKSYDNIIDEVAGNDDFDDEAGVRVHTVPGKPSTIAVEYAGGPILISVDAENDELEEGHKAEESYSESDSEDERERRSKRKERRKEDRKKKRTKADGDAERSKSSHRRHNRTISDDEEDDDDDDDDDDNYEQIPPTKAGTDKRSGEPMYTNHEQIQAEKLRLQEQLKQLEDERLREEEQTQRAAEKEKQEKAEQKRLRKEDRERRRALKREENERKRAKKLQRRLQRQGFMEPEAPVVLDAKPVVVYPSEVLNHPDYDSDELETEQLVTMQTVKQKAVAVAESLMRRWTDAEEEDEEELHARQSFGSDSSARPRKPPRPGLSDGDDSRSGLDESRTPKDQSPSPAPRPRSSLYGLGGTDVTAAAAVDAGAGRKFETTVRELTNEVEMERATVSMIVERRSKKTQWVDAKVVEQAEHFAEEPIPDDFPGHHGSTSVEEATLVLRSQSTDSPSARRAGLKFRVTGEVPKAYTRNDKESARRAFIQAPPVGIESSSEASDSERSLSRSGTADSLSDRLLQVRTQNAEQSRATTSDADQNQTGPEAAAKPVSKVRYAQPYTSFGKIEPKVDALEEAMLENEVELKMEEFWRQSKFGSTYAQVNYSQIRKPDMGNMATNDDSLSLGSVSDDGETSGKAKVKAMVVDTKAAEIIQPKKVVGTPTLLAGLINRPDLLVKTGKPGRDAQKDLSRSSDTLSCGDDLEQYDEEPSFRRPSSRSMSRDSDLDVEYYDQEPVSRKARRAAEDEEVATITGQKKKTSKAKSKRDGSDQKALKLTDSEPKGNGQEVGKKGRKQKRVTAVDADIENEELMMEEEMRYKSGSSSKVTTGKPEQVNAKRISVDVWEEAMASKPLASSEAFEIPPSGTTVFLPALATAKDRYTAKLKDDESAKWNSELLSGDDDLSKETMDELSYSSYIMTQNLTINGWTDNYEETNLDDFVADNESPVKVLELRPRDVNTSVVGRRQQRSKTGTAGVAADNTVDVTAGEKPFDDGVTSSEQIALRANVVQTSKTEELKRRDKREKAKRKEQRRSSGATIPITAVDANSTMETSHAAMSDDDDDEPYYNDQSRGSASLQLWQDGDDDSEEEHMYAYIENDRDSVRSSTSLNKRWEESSTASVRQPLGPDGKPLPLPRPPSSSRPQAPMRRIIPPLSPARSQSSRLEVDDVQSEERPTRLEGFKSFLRGDPGSFHRRPPVKRTQMRSHHQSYDAYTSESEIVSRRPYGSDVPSDTEYASVARQPKLRFGPRDVYSEAEASDFEGPPALVPGKSIKQSALEALNAGPVKRRRHQPPRSIILIHPGHHDKNFNHIRRMLAPRRKRVRGLTCVPSVGRYGDSALDSRQRTSRLQSGTDTETEDTSLIDFTQYDIIARLWMEQVRAQSVHRCDTMFLSLLPPGADLPRELTAGYRQSFSTSGDDMAMPPQWVMARSRTMGLRKSRKQNGDQQEEELQMMPLSSSPNRQSVLFFKVGGNWMDMAWVLFDGLQTDPETVRMIRDIQLKNPDGLAEQMHDLMHRWWSRRGRYATIDELRRALDAVHIAYIKEEFDDVRTSVIPYSDTEDELDVGEISEADPNVTRLIQEYEIRSLNVTMNPEYGTPPPLPVNPPPSLSQDVVLRHVKQKAARAERQKSGTSSRQNSSTELRPASRDQIVSVSSEAGPDYGTDDRKRTAVVHPQPLTSSFRHVSNL